MTTPGSTSPVLGLEMCATPLGFGLGAFMSNLNNFIHASSFNVNDCANSTLGVCLVSDRNINLQMAIMKLPVFTSVK